MVVKTKVGRLRLGFSSGSTAEQKDQRPPKKAKRQNSFQHHETLLKKAEQPVGGQIGATASDQGKGNALLLSRLHKFVTDYGFAK